MNTKKVFIVILACIAVLGCLPDKELDLEDIAKYGDAEFLNHSMFYCELTDGQYIKPDKKLKSVIKQTDALSPFHINIKGDRAFIVGNLGEAELLLFRKGEFIQFVENIQGGLHVLSIYNLSSTNDDMGRKKFYAMYTRNSSAFGFPSVSAFSGTCLAKD